MTIDENSFAFLPTNEFARVLQVSNDRHVIARLVADAARLNCLSMIACAGSGHIGSSFSAMDIATWLHLFEMNLSDGPMDADGTGDLYFSSKGHDAPGYYALLIGLGRIPETMRERLRRLDGLPGHPDVNTPGMVANTGSLGMGISKAKGIALADRLKGRERRIYVMLGDGELQEGQVWESALSAARLGLSNITAVVDHNKIQSDIAVADTSDLGDLEAKFTAFGWHVQRCDGHDTHALETTFAAAREDARPSIVIADTRKGAGVSFMTEMGERDGQPAYLFHSGAPSPADYARGANELLAGIAAKLDDCHAGGAALDSVPRPSGSSAADGPFLPAVYGDVLIEATGRTPRLIALDADLALDTGLWSFKAKHPDRFVECGIAEQDMVSMAAGAASAGALPICHSFSCFMPARANEQIYNQVTEGTKVIYVGTLAGVVPAAPGHSHQAVRDIGAMADMPGLLVVEPSCAPALEALVPWLIEKWPTSAYLRLSMMRVAPRFDWPVDWTPVPGQGVEVWHGADAVLFSYGPTFVDMAIRAANEVASSGGPDVAVVDMPWLNRIDADWLAKTVADKSTVFVLDNHYESGGLGMRMASTLAGLPGKDRPRCLVKGLRDIPACGQPNEVLRHHGLAQDDLVAWLQSGNGAAA
jgi:transketolase